MNRSDARAGRRVHVVYLEQGFAYGCPRDVSRDFIDNRSPTGMGTLIAPYPNTDGLIWYVRYAGNMRMALHSLDELEVEVVPGGAPRFREREELEDARERERQREEEAELEAEARQLATRISDLQERLLVTVDRLTALRENRRRTHVPAPPPDQSPRDLPRLPEEPGERHLDI